MNYFDRRRVLKNTNTLELIPVRLRLHKIEEGITILLVPRFKSKFVLTLLPSLKKSHFKVKLDKTGSSVWEAIDGERSVGDIARQLKSENGENKDTMNDFEERLGKYMSMLYERRYISFTQLSDN